MIKNLLTIVLLFVFLSGQSQVNDYFDDIKKTFDKKDQKNLSKISKEIIKAQSLEGDAQQAFVSGDFKKASSKSKKISEIYKKNYRELFLIYKSKLNKLTKEIEGDNKTYIADLIQNAKKSYSEAISQRHLAIKEKDNKTVYELYKSAHENEVDAIGFQSRSFGIINGWIKEEVELVEEEDYILENNFDNSATENFKVKQFSDEEASKPENYSFNKEKQIEQNLFSEEESIVNTTEDNKSNTYGKVNDSGGNTIEVNTDYVNSGNNYNSDNSNSSGYSDSNNNSNYSSAGTEFRIQIGTSILPANESQISRLNSTDLSVNTYKSRLYYKYTIGNFSSFEEAKNYKNAYGLSKTYITKYENGKEVKFYMGDSQ